VDGVNSVSFEDISYLNTDMWKFESSQSEDSRIQPVNFSKACSEPRTFKRLGNLSRNCSFPSLIEYMRLC